MEAAADRLTELRAAEHIANETLTEEDKWDANLKRDAFIRAVVQLEPAASEGRQRLLEAIEEVRQQEWFRTEYKHRWEAGGRKGNKLIHDRRATTAELADLDRQEVARLLKSFHGVFKEEGFTSNASRATQRRGRPRPAKTKKFLPLSRPPSGFEALHGGPGASAENPGEGGSREPETQGPRCDPQ